VEACIPIEGKKAEKMLGKGAETLTTSLGGEGGGSFKEEEAVS